MFIKNEKYNLLEKGIEKLNDTLQEGNIHELSYLLGNKKEMVKRNSNSIVLILVNCFEI